MHRVWLAAMVGSITACSDTALKSVNTAPTALITSLSDEAELEQTEDLRLIGRIADDQHSAE